MVPSAVIQDKRRGMYWSDANGISIMATVYHVDDVENTNNIS